MDNLRGVVAFVALLGAIGLPTIGLLFFRQPGVSVWDAQVPIWQAGEYLTGTGVVLRLAGYRRWLSARLWSGSSVARPAGAADPDHAKLYNQNLRSNVRCAVPS